MISLTAQVNWFEKWWTEYGNDEMFVSYISWKDGKVYDFDPAMKEDPEFSYMFSTLSAYRKEVEMTQPYLLLNNRPLYESKRSPGTFDELGIPIFFGFEMKITI